MFVHGREAYRKNSYLVLYQFWKNALLVLPIFYYGVLTKFSGTQFYDGSMYQGYNIFFTGMPVCWFCAFDFQYSKETFLKNPHYYKIGLKN
jgi:phospholipid-transporting ATPase